MDIKKRTKDIKNKLKELGYEVKHTHCREVLAIAHGYRNSHHLKGPSEITKALDTLLPKEIFLTVGVSPHTINEYYHDMFLGAKVYLNQNDINELIEVRDFIRDRSFLIDINVGEITPFENVSEEWLEKPNKANAFLEQEPENFPLETYAVSDLLEEGQFIFDKDFFQENNTYNTTGEQLSCELKASSEGINVMIYVSSKREEVIFSSYTVSWKELDLENKS